MPATSASMHARSSTMLSFGSALSLARLLVQVERVAGQLGDRFREALHLGGESGISSGSAARYVSEHQATSGACTPIDVAIPRLGHLLRAAAGHWMQQEQPGKVSRLLADFVLRRRA